MSAATATVSKEETKASTDTLFEKINTMLNIPAIRNGKPVTWILPDLDIHAKQDLP